MRRGVITLRATDNAADAAKLMKRHRIGSIVVTKDSKAVGIVTETDITYKIVAGAKDPLKTKLKGIMSSPLKTTGPDKQLKEVAELMRDFKIKRIPVVDKEQRLVGIITEDDVIAVLPGMVDVLVEDNKMREFKEKVSLAGVCDTCGSYSEALEKSGRKFLCEECREEEEV
jgi:CBS-domain-containing membrane protein